MNERKLSGLQKEYRNFFLEKMMFYGVKSPAELSNKRKSEFFSEIKRDWSKYKLAKKQLKELNKKDIQTAVNESLETYNDNSIQDVEKDSSSTETVKPQNNHSDISNRVNKKYYSEKKIPREEDEQPSPGFSKHIIKSEPNSEQTDDLRILFKPNNHFDQVDEYSYPVVKMPEQYSILKLPRKGRSNQKGYKENDFYELLKQNITDIELANDIHLVIPNFNKPYEPDIVLFDKSLNLYIDIEIDEPYDGYYRYPTHYINPEDDTKQDNVRDLFFTESGWVVIRFTEKQVHCQSNECVNYIKNVLNSIYNKVFTKEVVCETEDQWDYNQSVQWQKLHYREKYLGIERFNKQHSFKEIEIDISENESVESVIQRTKKFNFDNWSNSIAFDEEAHKYIHPKDETGNAEYISVTTLIERFFPFDLKRYIERKAVDENRTEEEILDEYLLMRDEAAAKGTYLHKQIENFLKRIDYDSDSKEFKMFFEFYQYEILVRNLIFFDAEKMIFSNKYNVAGTIDCLFRKSDKDEYVMLDWKRSKKLIIDGRPRIFGYGNALSELSTLDNSSYYRYCLQQNIYKQLVETEYSLKISSMKLVVLHENYSTYHVVNVPEMKRETNIILNSLKVKI
jgi:hypothetical protein